MEYYKTKYIFHVMKVLGHKNIHNTLIYMQLVDFQDDDYVSRAAKTVEDGFEYVCEIDDLKIFKNINSGQKCGGFVKNCGGISINSRLYFSKKARIRYIRPRTSAL